MATAVTCPLSDRPMQPWLSVPVDWRRPHVPQSYELYWCEASQFGMVYPRPTLEDISGFYEVEYFTHSPAAEPSSQPQRSFLEKVKGNLAWRCDFSVPLTDAWWQDLLGEASVTCCELGCGNGANLLQLKRLNHQVCGVEPDSSARQVAQAADLPVFAGAAEFIPPELANRQFDLVLMSHSLEHCLDCLGALRNAVKLLKPGGRLVVETPNNQAIGGQVSGIAWPWLDVPRHLNFFTTQSLKLACEQVGLSCERTEYQGYYRQFSRDWLQLEWQAWQAFEPYVSSADQLTPAALEAKYWRLLAATLWTAPDRKYDSVRIVARKAA